MPTTAARNAAKPLTLSRTLARRVWRCPLVFVVAASYHAWQSRGHATPTVFDDELLYGKLSQSIAAGHGLLDPRRALLLPRPARAARPVARLAARLDDGRLHGRQDSERGRDVGGGLPRVLARAPRRSAVLRTPHRGRGGGDAGARLPRATSCRRRSRIRSSSSPSPSSCTRVAKPSRRMAIAVPLICLARRRDPRAVPRPPARVPRGGRALRTRRTIAAISLPAALTAALVAVLLGVPGALGQYGEATHLGLRPPIGRRALGRSSNGYAPPVLARARDRRRGALFGLGFMLGSAAHASSSVPSLR